MLEKRGSRPLGFLPSTLLYQAPQRTHPAFPFHPGWTFSLSHPPSWRPIPAHPCLHSLPGSLGPCRHMRLPLTELASPSAVKRRTHLRWQAESIGNRKIPSPKRFGAKEGSGGSQREKQGTEGPLAGSTRTEVPWLEHHLHSGANGPEQILRVVKTHHVGPVPPGQSHTSRRHELSRSDPMPPVVCSLGSSSQPRCPWFSLLLFCGHVGPRAVRCEGPRGDGC